MEKTYVDYLLKADIPFFRLSKAPTDYIPSHSYVAVDDFAGGYKAGKHLIDLGVKNILHIQGPSNSRDALERKKGFLQACREYDFPQNQSIRCRFGYSQFLWCQN